MKKHKTNPTKAAQLAPAELYQRNLDRLKNEIQNLGYICLGSVTERWMLCGNPSCPCHEDAKQRHGPYYNWTRKVGGRTQGRLLAKETAPLYREGIENNRRINRILEEMRELSLAVFETTKINQNA